MRAWILTTLPLLLLGCRGEIVNPSSSGTGSGETASGGDPCVDTGGGIGSCGQRSSGPVQVAWVRRFGQGTGSQSVSAMGIDPQGAITLVGDLDGTGAGTVDFGQGPIGKHGHQSAFVARFDGKAQVQWAKAFSASAGGDIDASYAGVGPNGEVLLAGSIGGDVSFDAEPVSGSYAAYAARLDATGVATWARSFGDDTYFSGGRGFFDAAGRATIVAESERVVDFGGGPTLGGWGSVEIVRFDDAGTYAGSKHLQGQLALAAPDGEGGVVVLLDGKKGADTAGCGAAASNDLALIRILEDGTCAWQRSISGLDSWSLSARGAFVGLTGDCIDPVSIDGDAAIHCGQLAAMFDLDGGVRWIYPIPRGCARAYSIAVDDVGGAAVGLGADSDVCVDLGQGHLLSGDAFLVRLDSQGQWVWQGIQGSDAGTMSFDTIAFDAQGATIFASSTHLTLDVGSGPIPGADVKGPGWDTDVFIAKLVP